MTGASSHVRMVCIAILSIVFVALWSVSGQTAPPRKGKSPFKIGDKVEFDWGGESVPAEVLAIDGNTGWVRVRCTLNGHETTMTFPPDRFLPPAKKGDAKPKTDKPRETRRPDKGDEMQTWTDVTGKHKIQAQFLDLTNDKVRLKKADGTTTTLPLDKLCETDQKRAKQLAEGSDDDDPFVSDQPGDAASEKGGPANADWSKVRRINIDQAAKGVITPDAATDEKLNKLRPMMLEPSKNASRAQSPFESVSGLFLDRQRQRVVVVSVNEDPRGGGGTRLQSCNLKTAKSSGSITLNTTATLVDLSPDGTSVVCVPSRSQMVKNKSGGVEVWRLEKSGVLVNRWNADEPDAKVPIATDRALFVSPEQILTVNTWTGTVTLWNIEGAQAVYTLESAAFAMPALSANRKQLAVASQQGICILDAATGAPLAHLPSTRDNMTTFAFRRDGRQLAVLSPERLRVWNLDKEEPAHEVWFPTAMRVNKVEWVDDDHVLVDGSFLVDIQKRIVLWEYSIPGQTESTVMVDGRLCYLLERIPGPGSRGHEFGMFFVELPDVEATRVAAGLTDDQILAIKPGIQVNLSVQLPGAKPEDTKQVTESLTAQLKANGITVAAGAPITLEAAVASGETRSMTYENHFARTGDQARQTVNVTEQIARLTFKENDRVLWERRMTSGGAPMVVHHKEGQSVNDAIAQQQPSPAQMLLGVPLPQYVARHGEKGRYGASSLTANGPAPLPAGK